MGGYSKSEERKVSEDGEHRCRLCSPSVRLTVMLMLACGHSSPHTLETAAAMQQRVEQERGCLTVGPCGGNNNNSISGSAQRAGRHTHAVGGDTISRHTDMRSDVAVLSCASNQLHCSGPTLRKEVVQP